MPSTETPHVGDTRREQQWRHVADPFPTGTEELVSDRTLVFTRTGGWVDIREVLGAYDALRTGS